MEGVVYNISQCTFKRCHALAAYAYFCQCFFSRPLIIFCFVLQLVELSIVKGIRKNMVLISQYKIITFRRKTRVSPVCQIPGSINATHAHVLSSPGKKVCAYRNLLLRSIENKTITSRSIYSRKCF